MIKEKVKNSTIKYNANKNNGKDVNIYEDLPGIDIAEGIEGNNDNKDDPVDEPVEENNGNGVKISLLGEIMMGGKITTNNNYIYMKSIKDVYSSVNRSDFTYANFSTNITNLEKIVNPKSKYLVTTDVISALYALGIDAVSIASDHIVDYDSAIIKNTIGKLEQYNIFVAGRKDTPVYLEKGDKRISIVSTNSVIIGTSKTYEKNDISIYSADNLRKNIKEAKENSDFVIVDVHWGRDTQYGITTKMVEIARIAIDNGADLVIGTHALGVYPIQMYKGKPIIYSLGTLITDSTYATAKEGFMFNINISQDKKLESIEMIPTYIIDQRETLLYSTYDYDKCESFLKRFNEAHAKNGINSKIERNKIIVNM